MQLSLHADYACRCLIYLAVQSEGSIPAIAEAYGISRHHLVKVAHRLSQEGYVLSTRGKGGGLSLARPAHKIVIGDVVRKMESHFDIVECFDPATNTCRIVPGCGLRHALKEARQAFLAVLDEYSLDDVVKDRAYLRNVWAVAR